MDDIFWFLAIKDEKISLATQSSNFPFFLIYFIFIYFFIVVGFVIHWNESAMDLHVFPILIPPPTSLSTRSL